MVWRRIAVSSSCTLRELHGAIQVAMGWEGIHLFQFCLRAARYGSWEVSASSPDVKLAELQLRKGTRFLYEYDLNVPWEHEVRLEDRTEPETGKKYPSCLGGGGHCPAEDCDGPAGFMDGRHALWSMDSLEDLTTVAGVIDQVLLQGHEAVLGDEATRSALEDALERSRARERAKGQPFSRRTVNTRFHRGDHRILMHQNY